MKRYILIVIALVLLSSCKKVTKSYYSDGTIRSEVSYTGGDREGRARYYYPNGALQQEVWYKNDQLDGIMRQWKATGVLLLEEHYKSGKKNGPSIQFDMDGRKSVELHYVNDTLEAKAREWYGNGVLRTDGNYLGGRYEGDWLWYGADGKIVGKGSFKDGTGVAKAYYPNGKVLRVTRYRLGLHEGKEELYDSTGILTKVREYQAGKIIKEQTIAD